MMTKLHHSQTRKRAIYTAICVSFFCGSVTFGADYIEKLNALIAPINTIID